MARPRKNPLPSGVYVRQYASGEAYWINFVDQGGKRRREPAGSTLDEAKRLLAQRQREVANGSYDPVRKTATVTLNDFAARFLATRSTRSVDRERQIFRDFIEPTIGARPLAEIRPRVVAQWVADLRRGRDGRVPADKSVCNIHGVLSVLLEGARFEDLITDNPARGLPPGVLPENRRMREKGAWTREEVETLISSERIPEDRRVLYAIGAFTGARLGEAAGMRWRDLDTKAAPLWRWALRTQWGGEPLKTDRARDVPIHPELRRVLAEWKMTGWPRLMCRAPRPDDFAVPYGEAGGCLTMNAAGAKSIQRNARHAGLDPEGRDFHSLRRAFITVARLDGAPTDLLERVTHNKRGEMLDVYTYFGWDALCGAVSKVRLAVRRGATVTHLLRLRAAGGEEVGHTVGHTLAATDENAQEDKGSEWRWRESNPRPKALRADFYVCSSCVESRGRAPTSKLSLTLST